MENDWLRYSNTGATRNKPISPELIEAMKFLPEMGLTMDVYSGGQDAKGHGTQRTGSERHDHGSAADAKFYRGDEMLDFTNEDHRPIFEEIVQRAKAGGATGIGAGVDYMGPNSMHIGFGDPAVWGAEGKGENAPDWLKAAYHGEAGLGPTGEKVKPSAGINERSSKGNTDRSDYKYKQPKVGGKLHAALHEKLGGDERAGKRMSGMGKALMSYGLDMLEDN